MKQSTYLLHSFNTIDFILPESMNCPLQVGTWLCGLLYTRSILLYSEQCLCYLKQSTLSWSYGAISQCVFASCGISHLCSTFCVNNDIIYALHLSSRQLQILNLSIQLLYNPDETLTVEPRGQFQPGKVTNYKISLNILTTQDIF